MYKLVLILALLSFNSSAQVEADTAMIRIESELAVLLHNLRQSKNDTERELHNLTFYEAMKMALRKPGVMDHPFSQLTTVSTIKSPDNVFRIFNWNIETDQLSHKHFCFVVKKGRGIGKNKVIEFREDKLTIPSEPSIQLSPGRWYGALYYKIIPVKKSGKTFYTVLGFNGNTRSSNKKILEVFWFRGNSLKIGYPLFEASEHSDELKRRIFFEYSEKATVRVNFEAEIGKIVFNHLSPESENLKDFKEFYVPDLTYDAYYWKDGIWKYQKDIQVGNKTNNKIKIYNPNPTGKEDEFSVVKTKWEDPTSDGAVGEKHVATKIENDGKRKKGSPKKVRKKATKEPRKKRRKTKNRSAVELDQ